MTIISSLLLVAISSALAALPVRGVVEDPDGKPVEQAFVFMTPQMDTIEAPIETTTNARGEFAVVEPPDRFLLSPNDTRQLIAFKPDVGIVSIFVDQSLSADTQRLRLMPTTPVRVQVLDPQGSPVIGAEFRVRLFSLPNAALTMRGLTLSLPGPHFRSRTNAQGEVTVAVIPENASFIAEVRSEAFGTQLLDFHGGAQEHTRLLRQVGNIRGRILVADAPDLSGLPIVVMSAPPNIGADAQAAGLAEVVTDADGRFEIPALAAGQVVIQKTTGNSMSRYILPEQVQTTLAAGETKEIVIPAERAVRVHGLVVEDDEDARPIAGVKLNIQVNSTRARRIAAYSRSTLTGKDGAYEFYVPRGGAVTKLVRSVPLPFLEPRAEIRAATPLDEKIDELEFDPIRLRRGVPLSGTVVDEQNLPVPHARVKAAWSASDKRTTSYHSATGETDEHGEFVIPGVSNSYAIELTASDDKRGSMAAVKIDAARPEARTLVRLVVEPAGLISISGRVIDAAGAPVGGVNVQFIALSRRPDGWPSESGEAVRFQGVQRIATDADGRFQTPHPISRLADYSVELSARPPIRTRVRVPTAGKTEDRVTIPDITLTPNDK
jgi:protocatechuate 3,4-dioxygenase beta subunit